MLLPYLLKLRLVLNMLTLAYRSTKHRPASLLCFIIFCLKSSFSYSQMNLLLFEHLDSLSYKFYNIQPQKLELKAVLPNVNLKAYTLSRSIKLKSLSKTLSILIGETESSEKVIVFDSNMNNDFSDEIVNIFSDTTNSVAQGNYKHFETDVYLDGKQYSIEFDYSIIKPLPLRLSYGDTLEDKFHLFVKPFQYRTTNIVVLDTTYHVYLLTKQLYDFERNSSFIVVSRDSNIIRDIMSKPLEYEKYFQGDFVKIGQKQFVFDSISNRGSLLSLNSIDENKKLFGNKAGYYLSKFSSSDIVSNKLISSTDFLGKYLILDFWGTWCGPCIQILDDLKKLHNSLDSRKFSTLGICFDRDREVAKRFIEKKNITWPQLFDLNSKGEIVRLLDVKEYPSFILVDPMGKIVYRDNGIRGFSRIKKYIESIK